MNKINKKGFTLVELLAVIVVLALVIVIAATKGFGAFDTAKDKITSMNKDAIDEAIEIIKLDIEHCDDSNEELLGMFEVGTCGDLYTKLESGANVSLDKMIEKEYITGAGIGEIKKEEIFDVTFNKTVEGISVIINNEEKKAILLKRNYNTSTERYYSYKDKIVEVYFVDYVDIEGKTNWDVTNASISNTKVYAWLENASDGNYKLYFGSEGKIYAPSDSSFLFSEFINVKNITFNNIDTSNVINMRAMFHRCDSLIELDLNSFDTSNVENMWDIFSGCKSLVNLNISSFKTTNVKYMTGMFYNCKLLTSLDLSHFNTSNVESMAWMFRECSGLTNVNLSSFDTKNVTNMVWMFSGCVSLIDLDISNFKTSKDKLADIRYMFQNCSKITYLDLSGFKTNSSVLTTGLLENTANLNKVCVNQSNSSEIYSIVAGRPTITIGCN